MSKSEGRRDLMDGERVIYEGTLHPILFSKPLVMSVVFVAVGVAVYRVYHSPAAWAILVIAALVWVPAFLRYQTNRLILTSQRVLGTSGMLLKDSYDILLTKVEGVSVEQDVLGRLFNYGTIVIRGTGGGKERFSSFGSPTLFSKKVHEQIVAGAP